MALIINFFNLSPTKIDSSAEWQIFISEELLKTGDELIYLVRSTELGGRLKILERKNLRIQFIPTRNRRGFKLIGLLLKFFNSEKPDIVNLNFVNPLDAIMIIILSKIILPELKCIYTKHSPGRLILGKISIKRYLNPLKLLSYFVERIICVSESIRLNCINRGCDADKVVTIYNGINIKKYETCNDTGKIRSEFSIPHDYRIITTVKDARPEVGLKDLLYSISEVLKDFKKVIFLIVGGGAETENLKRLADELGISNNVIFTGIRNDIPEILSESYFTIDPSPVEAFGLVITESMAAQKPVIGVNSWGPKEIIVNGETGFLVNPGNPTDFVDGIRKLLSSPDLTETMRRRALVRVKECFDIRDMAKNYARLFGELLGRIPRIS